MIIVGMGRVGQGIARRAARNRVPHHCIDREQGWEALGSDVHAGPVLVCVNPDDLDELLGRIPETRRCDLVFTQNGMLDTYLRERSLDENTRGLLYFAAPDRGSEIQPGGESIFCGPHAESMANWFHAIELGADAVSRNEFTNNMAGKLIWNCVFGLLCETSGKTVGELVVDDHSVIAGLATELVGVSNAAIGTTLSPQQVTADLCAYSLSIPTYKGSLKQLAWRNGWFVDAAIRVNATTPIHAKFMHRASVDSI